MYIRNLRKASPVKTLYKFASAKIGETIMCEGSIEFDACFHHEFNNSVESFRSQPQGFYYEFDGKLLPYTPDTLIRYVDGRLVFHEYKPFRKTLDPIFRARFVAKQATSRSLGIELILVTEKQVRVNPVLNNLKLLHRYSGPHEVNNFQRTLLRGVQSSGPIRLNQIAEEHRLPLGETRALVITLISKGLLAADLDGEDLTLNPLVWRAE